MPAYQSWASSPASRKVMQGNRSRDTSPELAVRRLLHAAGLRYRVAYRPEPSLRRTADIVFTKQRVAVFVDGCYWHACPEHGTRARANAEYWSAKLQRNVARDADTTARLEAAGWTVLRFWEHEDPTDVANRVVDVVRWSAGKT
ncbi:very short patch repair endonuclease [Nocardioides sp.]|uniref:very short patch repair endonuclease n=1 Tax=Nocardioides sp. TaxID=35761 RepID=UPI003511AED2